MVAQSVKSLPHSLEDLSLVPSTYVKSWPQRAGDWLETIRLGVSTRDSVPAGAAKLAKYTKIFPIGIMTLSWEGFGEHSERSWVRGEVDRIEEMPG